MCQQSENIRSRVKLVTIGLALLMGACSSDATAPKQALSIVASQGTSLTIGAVTITGASTIVDSMLQVSVTVKNDSTAAIWLSYGPPCADLGIALYQSATHTGQPVWKTYYPGMCPELQNVQVNPGQSQTVTEDVLLSSVTQGSGAVAAGTYDVAATISLSGDISSGTVDAGTVTVQ